MSSQLFNVRAVNFPYSVMFLSDGPHISSQHIECFPFMSWPDGRPCEIINMYFIDIAHTTTGETLKNVASKLTHVVRYCWKEKIAFSALTDGDFHELSNRLISEKSNRDPQKSVRNHNTVRSILGQIISFLFWYNDNFFLFGDAKLISESSGSSQITVERHKNPYTKRFYFLHRAMPKPNSTDPKTPIGSPIIEAIEDAINELSLLEKQPEPFRRRFQKQPMLLSAQLEYMRARRKFMVWLLKRTGLRPSEMVAIDVSLHSNILNKRILFIPTRKQRKDVAPLREFPITLKDAGVVQRYLLTLQKYRVTLAAHNSSNHPENSLFLSASGGNVEKSSLERDFARLVVAAGYKDTRACISMFRHRFITIEVLVHLKEFMRETKKHERNLMTHADYISILKRVAVKTGHSSIQSLWYYIDLAWAEINVWGNVDKAIARHAAADRLSEQLRELKHRLNGKNGTGRERKLIEWITHELDEILGQARKDLAPAT